MTKLSLLTHVFQPTAVEEALPEWHEGLTRYVGAGRLPHVQCSRPSLALGLA